MLVSDLLSQATRIAFVYLTLVTAIDYLRHRHPTRLNVFLIFASISTIFLLQILGDLLALEARWLNLVGAVALLAHPYLMLRLVQHFRPLHRWVHWIAIGGFTLSTVGILFFSDPIPPIFSLVVVIYFAVCELYAAAAFVRGAFQTQGVTRRLLRLAAAGSGILGGLFVVAGLVVLLPALAEYIGTILQITLLASTIFLYLAFAPPRWLRQTWRSTDLLRFTQATTQKMGVGNQEMQLQYLEAAAHGSAGATSTVILNLNDTGKLKALKPEAVPEINQEKLIRVIESLDWSSAGTQIHYRSQVVGADLAALFTETDTQVLYVLPVKNAHINIGCIAIFVRHKPLFAQEVLDFLDLLAQQTALVLENQDLIDQLRRANEQLEEKVGARTAELAESEHRFRGMFEQAAVGIAEMTFQGFLFHVNERFQQIVGYTASELERLTLRDLTHPEDLETDRESIEALRNQTIASYAIQKRFLRKDDSLLWVNLTASLVDGHNDGAKHMLVVLEDISERKSAEVARHEAETRFARVLDTTAEAVISIDASHRIILFNQSAERIFGYKAGDMLGQPLDTLLPPEMIQHHQHFVRDFAEGRDVSRGMGQRQKELSARRKDGTIFPIAASISKLTASDQVILTVFVRDITEQKEAEAALLASEGRYHRIIDNMLEGFQIISFDWRYLYINDSAARYGRTAKEDLIGFTILEKYPGIETTPMYASMRECMEERRLQLAEFEFTYPDGERAWFQFSIQPVPEGISILSLDVTERKEAVEALLDMNEELERRVVERTSQLEATNQELEAFTYSVSHDLRAPLRAMSGFARQLQDKHAGDMPERAQHYLNRIEYNASRMGNLIDDLLTLSRVGRKSLETRQVNLSRIVQDILRELDTGESFPQTHIQLDDLPQCQVDPALIKQVYQNLITNALKFTQKKDAPHIHIGCEQVNGDLVYFVKDNGVGFDMQFAHKLFGVFERLHSAQEYEGTGIGLATVQRVIHRHGGLVWANAEIGEGATFYFTLGGEHANGK